jgi:hypothetical protein
MLFACWCPDYICIGVLALVLNDMYKGVPFLGACLAPVILIDILVTLDLLTLLLIHSCFCCWVATHHTRHTSCISRQLPQLLYIGLLSICGHANSWC